LLAFEQKKTLRKALIDSREYFNSTKEGMDGLARKIGRCEERVFKLRPEEILAIAEEIINQKEKSGS
jgi:hypothetical protein